MFYLSGFFFSLLHFYHVFPSDTFQPLFFSWIVSTKRKTYQELKFQTHNSQVDLKLEKSILIFLYP